MTGFWARITGRAHAEADQQAVEVSQMGSEEREFAEEGPTEIALDQEVQGHLGGPDVPDEFDDVEKLLGGPTS